MLPCYTLYQISTGTFVFEKIYRSNIGFMLPKHNVQIGKFHLR